MTTLSSPLVSCLLVTRGTPERLAGLAHAITCYQRQTYSELELVIVTDADARPAVDALVQSQGPQGVRTFCGREGMTLGALRNLSMAKADGALLCQWDDDDLFHPQRVAEQVACLANSEAKAVFLEDVLQYYPESRQLWWTNWRATEARGHPGTLLCARDCGIAYPETGEQARRGEDLAVARELIARNRLTTLRDKPFLYVYVSHGHNTYEAAHHRMLSTRLAVSRGRILRQQALLQAQLAPFESLLRGADVMAANLDDPVFQVAGPV